MGITPLRFTGVSEYSADFQTILERAVQIAALPIQQMQNKQSDAIAKKQLLSGIGNKVQALAEAVSALGAQGSKKGLAVTSSNESKVKATLMSSGSPASYIISDINSVARRASEATSTGLATSDSTAVDSDNTLELFFDGTAYAIDLTTYGNTLEGLKEAVDDIISDEGLTLTSSLINSGDPDTPYHLVLSAGQSGAKSLQLWTGAGQTGTNLLTNVNQGADTVFKLNGVTITSTDTLITGVIPGVNLNILDTTDTETITIDMSSGRSGVSSALSDFVTAYNSLAADLRAQTGLSAGLLSGDSMVNHTKSLLRQITGYKDGDGVIGSLAGMGIELANNGEMSFKTATFNALSTAEFQDVFRFLGSETTGFGGMVAGLDELSSPFYDDLIDAQIDTYEQTDERLTLQIETLSERILLMQTNMMSQLQQADVLLASLEGQQRILDASLQAVEYGLYGKRDG